MRADYILLENLEIFKEMLENIEVRSDPGGTFIGRFIDELAHLDIIVDSVVVDNIHCTLLKFEFLSTFDIHFSKCEDTRKLERRSRVYASRILRNQS